MLQDKTVKELLVPISEYLIINADASVKDAFFLLRKNFEDWKGFRSIFVFDEEDNLKGHVSMIDLIQAVEPKFFKEVSTYQGPGEEESELILICQQLFSEQCREEAKKPIIDVMRPVEAILSSEDPITKAAYMMVKNKIRVLPVHEKGKIVGVIRLTDVFNWISGLIIKD